MNAIPSMWVSKDSVEIRLEDVAFYEEWLKGETSGMCIYRAADDFRVIGARLPFRKSGEIRVIQIPHGELVLPPGDRVTTEQCQQLLEDARAVLSSIPPWRKPPVDVPIQAAREFIARFGPDVAVLATWTHETGAYQFVTIGCDKKYADAAVRLRDELTKSLDLELAGPNEADLRDDHPNVRLTKEQTDFLLWVLGRTFAEADTMNAERKAYVQKYHSQLLPVLGAVNGD